MTMTSEEAQAFRAELDAFWLSPARNRIEFSLRNWHVTMYRLGDQTETLRKTIRVDFVRRDMRPHPDHPKEVLYEVEA